jgi:Prokaryotic lipoprotein-attachment site
MSGSSSIEPAGSRPSRRRLLLALVALGALAACGKKGSLRLPEPGEMDDEEDAG